jgi:hypothetical protein
LAFTYWGTLDRLERQHVGRPVPAVNDRVHRAALHGIFLSLKRLD